MDRRQIIKSYFQHKHLEKEGIRLLYIEPIVEEFGLITDYVELMQTFGSIDEIPPKFVEDLGASLAYEYVQDESSEVQREIIKRILTVYKNRASKIALQKTLQSSTDLNWIGEDLTLYKGPVVKGYQSISIPRDQIFMHDKSRHDSGHRFMDRFHYNYGVIDLEMQYYNERTLKMLERQIPGGVRYNISQLVWIDDGNYGQLPSYFSNVSFWDFTEDFVIKNDKIYIPEDYAMFDRPNKKLVETPVVKLIDSRGGEKLDAGRLAIYKSTVRSGRRVAIADIAEEYISGASYIDVPKLDLGKLGELRPIRLDAGLLGTKSTIVLMDLLANRHGSSILHKTDVPSIAPYEEVYYKGIRYEDVSEHDDGKSRDGAQDYVVTLFAHANTSFPASITEKPSVLFTSSIKESCSDECHGFEMKQITRLEDSRNGEVHIDGGNG